MTYLKNMWGLLSAISLISVGVVLVPLSAAAYSGSVSLGSGSSSSIITTSAAPSTASISGGQPFAFPYPGGMFEVGASAAGSSTIVINAFKNGSLDTSFNSTGRVSFTSQILQSDRTFLTATTYNNGANWAILDTNGYPSQHNYLYLGSFAAGYTSVITLPTTNSLYTTCSNLLPGTFGYQSSGLSLVPNVGYAAPMINLTCGAYLSANGSTYASKFNYLYTYSGGTVLGTPATLNSVGSVSPIGLVNSSTKKTVTNFGVSVNPNATGSQVALTYLYALTDGTSYDSPAIYDTTNYTDYVVVRVTAAGTITQTAGAWSGVLQGSRTGSVVVYPRNNGTVYAIQCANNISAATTNILSFTASGTATSIAVTGASMLAGFTKVVPVSTQGTTLKVAALNVGSASYFNQIDATTGVATNFATFTPNGGNSYDSFNWQAGDNPNGMSFYARTSSTQVLTVLASTAPMAPAAPSAPTVVNGSGQASLSWTAPSNNGSAITAYTVDYSTDAGSTWSTWSSSIATTNTVVTGLTNGTAYVFRVSATNGVGTSSASTSSTSVTPNPVPGAPTGLQISGNGSNSVALTWTASSPLNTLTDYVVQYSADGGTTWVTYADGISSATTATISGLTAGTSYVFRVSGSNGIGAGSPSTASVSITSATVPAAVSSAPTVVANPGSVAVTWNLPNNGGSALVGAELQYSINSGSTWSNYTGSVDVSGTISATGLNAGQSYIFRVRASNYFGSSASWSAASSAVTALPATAPGTVTGLAVAAGPSAGTMSLTWTTPNANGSDITDYQIEYSSDGGVTWQVWSHTASSATSAIVTGLNPGTNYQFRVTAVNSIGSSTATAPSTAVAATQQVVAPAPSPSSEPPLQLPISAPANRKVDVADGKVVFDGTDMSVVKLVLMNDVEAVILSRSVENITVQIPKDVLGWVNVEFVTAKGTFRFESLIYVENVKANQLAKLRLGLQSRNELTKNSANRFAAVNAKFLAAKQVTCIGHYNNKISRSTAIAKAKFACSLIHGRNPRAEVRIAVSTEVLHAHVLAVFNY